METEGVLKQLREHPKTHCSIDYNGRKKYCTNEKDIHVLQNFLIKSGLMENKVMNLTLEELIYETMRKLKVDTEEKIYTHPSFKQTVGGTKSYEILKKRFKILGPYDTDALLDNFNIDNVLDQWMNIGCEQFNNKFYHIPFKMIDFKFTGPELYHLDIVELIAEGYDSFGVVLNTDVSTGGGKHWFCIYGDLKHKGTEDDPYIVEYFNSSANPPPYEVSEWLNKMKIDTYKNHRKYLDYIYSSHKRLQHSRTECGVWSLVYILNRLENKPPTWLNDKNINDVDMYNYRKFLFR